MIGLTLSTFAIVLLGVSLFLVSVTLTIILQVGVRVTGDLPAIGITINQVAALAGSVASVLTPFIIAAIVFIVVYKKPAQPLRRLEQRRVRRNCNRHHIRNSQVRILLVRHQHSQPAQHTVRIAVVRHTASHMVPRRRGDIPLRRRADQRSVRVAPAGTDRIPAPAQRGDGPRHPRRAPPPREPRPGPRPVPHPPIPRRLIRQTPPTLTPNFDAKERRCEGSQRTFDCPSRFSAPSRLRVRTTPYHSRPVPASVSAAAPTANMTATPTNASA